MFKNIADQKKGKRTVSCSFSVRKKVAVKKTIKRFPDLTEFRKSIHAKGEPLSQTVIKGRG